VFATRGGVYAGAPSETETASVPCASFSPSSASRRSSSLYAEGSRWATAARIAAFGVGPPSTLTTRHAWWREDGSEDNDKSHTQRTIESVPTSDGAVRQATPEPRSVRGLYLDPFLMLDRVLVRRRRRLHRRLPVASARGFETVTYMLRRPHAPRGPPRPPRRSSPPAACNDDGRRGIIHSEMPHRSRPDARLPAVDQLARQRR